MVQELYLKYKDRYFEDFFTPEVRDLPKDKKELLLSELETMRKSTKIMENRLYTGSGKEFEKYNLALTNAYQRGIIAAHLVLDQPHKAMLTAQEVMEVLEASCSIAEEKQSDLYYALSWKWKKEWNFKKNSYEFKPFDTNTYYKVSDSGKVFYEQCMRDYRDSQKREKFLNLVNTESAVKLATKQSSSLHASNQGIER